MNIKALEGKTSRLVLEARRRLPDQDGFLFVRNLFSAGDWSRLAAFLEAIKQPAHNVQWRHMPREQLDQLCLWVYLQEESKLQHRNHAAIVRRWLNTPWSENAARLVELYNQGQGQLPGITDSRYGLNSIAQDLVSGREISVSWRGDIRRYLLQREQGIDYEPCIS